MAHAGSPSSPARRRTPGTSTPRRPTPAGRRHRQPVQISWQDEHWDEDGGAWAVDELLDGPTPPDALYCMTGHHAAGALARLQQRGLAVPGDVQLLCGSDTATMRATQPPITAVDLQPEILAAHAVTRLVNKLDGTDHPLPTELATGRIVERGSTRLSPGAGASPGPSSRCPP